MFSLIERLFRSALNKGYPVVKINLALRESLIAVEKVSPVKELKNAVYFDGSMVEDLERHFANLLRRMPDNANFKSQKTNILAVYFSVAKDSIMYSSLRKLDFNKKSVIYTYLSDSDAEILRIMNSSLDESDLERANFDEGLKKFIEGVDVLNLMRMVRAVALQASISIILGKLFNYKSNEDDLERRFNLLIKFHIDRLAAEFILKNVNLDEQNFSNVKELYNFSAAEERGQLISKFINLVGAGQTDEVDEIVDRFTGLFIKQHDAIKHLKKTT